MNDTEFLFLKYVFIAENLNVSQMSGEHFWMKETT